MSYYNKINIVIESYLSGMSIAEVSKKCRIPEFQVRVIIERGGIPMWKPGVRDFVRSYLNK